MTVGEILSKNKPLIVNIINGKHPKTKRFPHTLMRKLIKNINNPGDETLITQELSIGKGTLHRWKKQFSPKVVKPHFAEIKVNDTPKISPPITIISPSGYKISGDYNTLTRFIKEIEQ